MEERNGIVYINFFELNILLHVTYYLIFMKYCFLQDKQIDDIELWKTVMSSQVDQLMRENRILRFVTYSVSKFLSLFNKSHSVIFIM